ALPKARAAIFAQRVGIVGADRVRHASDRLAAGIIDRGLVTVSRTGTHFADAVAALAAAYAFASRSVGAETGTALFVSAADFAERRLVRDHTVTRSVADPRSARAGRS